MKLRDSDRTRISFGKLSDLGVMQRSSFADEELKPSAFSSDEFQYIVDHIAEMFGLRHGNISAEVVEDDYELLWDDRNGNQKAEDDELAMCFTMNAEILVYERQSRYGQHFMYAMAAEYGTAIIFGIVAHEIGHLITRYALSSLESRVVGGMTALLQTTIPNARWEELCADYLAGIVLAKAVPRISQIPMKQFLSGTEEDEAHPDGYWREFAVEMGYRWGCSHSSMLTSKIISDTEQLKQLLISFFETFYNRVYHGVEDRLRRQHSELSNALLEPCAIVLGEL